MFIHSVNSKTGILGGRGTAILLGSFVLKNSLREITLRVEEESQEDEQLKQMKEKEKKKKRKRRCLSYINFCPGLFKITGSLFRNSILVVCFDLTKANISCLNMSSFIFCKSSALVLFEKRLTRHCEGKRYIKPLSEQQSEKTTQIILNKLM